MVEQLRKEDYTVKPIPYKQAADVVIKNHYLHRKPAASFSFGLFKGDELVGVIMYGTPPSKHLRIGVAGPEEELNVIELQRLWIRDGEPKNAASFLIGRTIKQVDKEIVVSYADTSQHHVGVVYQAANFIYTGLSAKRTDRKVEGRSGHSYDLGWFKPEQLRSMYGDKYRLVDRPRKHRYVYINAKGKRKQFLLNKLRYPIQEYPKVERGN